MIALTRAPNGKSVSDIAGLRVIDIGGGDLHVTEVVFSPAQMINRRTSDGTIRIARALRTNRAFAGVIRNDVEAQQALVRQTAMRASRSVSIATEVQQAVASKGNAMVADVLAELRDSTQYVAITGGGVLLLRSLLADVLAHEAKEPGRDYLASGEVISCRAGWGAINRIVSCRFWGYAAGARRSSGRISMERTMLETLVAYHSELHRRLWDSVMQISDEQFVDDSAYAHGSIRNQLVHLATVETRWLRGLQGDREARAFQLIPEDYPTRAAFREQWEATVEALPAYLASLTEADLQHRAPGMEEPVWQVLLHLVIHGVDHRAQVLRLLHDHGAPTFAQDLIFYLWSRRSQA